MFGSTKTQTNQNQRLALTNIGNPNKNLKDNFENLSMAPVRELLTTKFINDAAKASGMKWRNRLFTPVVTLLTCIKVHLSREQSVRSAEDWINSFGTNVGRKTNGSTFSSSRKRLKIRLFRRCLKLLFEKTSAQGDRFGSLRVLTTDGTTVQVYGSKSNKTKFGHSGNQLGKSRAPIARAFFINCMATGVVMSSMLMPYKWGERRALYSMLKNIGSNNLVVGDGGLFSYLTLGLLAVAGSHGLFRKPARKINYLDRKKIADGEEIQTWRQSKFCKPTFKRQRKMAPDTLKVRIIKRTVRRKGYRDFNLILVTTLLDHIEFPADEFVRLYMKRWRVELDIRDIKGRHLKSRLSGRSPKAIQIEFASGVLAYSVTKSLMAKAWEAGDMNEHVRRLSHTRSVRLIIETAAEMRGSHELRLREVYNNMLFRIRSTTTANQERPPEPRQLVPCTRRYALLSTSRDDWRKANAA